jgi:hypothetical protein
VFTGTHGTLTINDTTTGQSGTAIVGASVNDHLTYSSAACPANFQGSAVIRLIDPQTGQPNSLNAANTSVANAFSGNFFAGLTDSVSGWVNNATSDIVGATTELAVFCSPAGGGTGEYAGDTFVMVNTAGTTFTMTNTPPAGPASTTVTLTASSTQVNSNITLTATVTASDGSTPAGTVTFDNGGTAITATSTSGPNPATLSSTGTATFVVSFTTTGVENLSAIYTPPTGSTSWTGNTGTLNLNVVAFAGNIPVNVTVPTSGVFTLSVGTTAVGLTPTVTTDASGNPTSDIATGSIPNGQIQVIDTRNSYPGWSVSGQDGNWAGGSPLAGSFSGNQLGWAPSSGTTAQAVAFGPTVIPAGLTGGTGLGTASVLASDPGGLGNYATSGVGNGFGTSNLGAALTLNIPLSAPPGAYNSTLTITAVPTHP